MPLQSFVEDTGILAEHNLSLSAASVHSRVYVNMEVMECPWEAKGKVMRQLIEEHLSERWNYLASKFTKIKAGRWFSPMRMNLTIGFIVKAFHKKWPKELTSFYAGRIKSIIAGKTE